MPNSLQQGILQGISPIPAVFCVFRAKFASDFSGPQQNSLRNGAGNFVGPSREFFRLSREFCDPAKTMAEVRLRAAETESQTAPRAVVPRQHAASEPA
jgi:hypothetical protein